MSGANFNNTDNKAVNEAGSQDLTNKTYNGVDITNEGGGGLFLANDGNYKTPAGGGDVTGPASSIDDQIAVFNGVTGTIIKDSGVKASDFLQSGDNVSELANDADYITTAEAEVALAFYRMKTAFVSKSVDYEITEDYENLEVSAIGSDVAIILPALGTFQKFTIEISCDSTDHVIIDAATNGSKINDKDEYTLVVPCDSVVINATPTGFSFERLSQVNTVIVNSLHDLPVPANVPALGYTAYTLDVNKVYDWRANLVMDYPFYVPSAGAPLGERGINVKGSRFPSGITWSGTTPLFYAEGEFALEFMNISCPNATVVDWNCTDASQSLVFQNGLYYNTKQLAEINGSLVTCSLRLVTTVNITGDGVVYNGSDAAQLNVTGGLFIEYAGNMFDVTAATDMTDVSISAGTRFNSTSVTSNAIAMGDSLAVDGAAILTGNRFNGSGHAISAPVDGAKGFLDVANNIFVNSGDALTGGATTEDLRVQSAGNIGLRSSKSIGSMIFENVYPATTQTTLITSTPVILSGAFTAGVNIERWSVIANPDDGAKFALQYDGTEDFEGFANMLVYGEESGAGSPDVDYAIYKNGVRQSPGAVIEPTGNSSAIPVRVAVTASTGDYFDFRLNRLNGSNNWQTRTAIMDIS